MKLYYFPGACSLAPHIALREAGLDFQIEKVDLATKRTESGGYYHDVNPKGYVPALRLDTGRVLTECPVILSYIADAAPQAQLAPPRGAKERWQAEEWLAFVATEIHKTFAPLFSPATPEDYKPILTEKIFQRFDMLERELLGDYLMNDYSVADIYLFVVLSWGKYVGIDIGRWPNLQAFSERVAARPAVQAALKAEGLI